MPALAIAITGASGFIGSAAVRHFERAGHEVIRLVRGGNSAPGTALWDPATGEIGRSGSGSMDVVVHLAGENIATKRWSSARKRAIADSRIPATERLCRRLAALDPKPRVLVSASAVGIYGDRGDELLDESSAPGTGFLAEVTKDWEAATRPASDAGIRVVNLRLGVVLDPSGGALRAMLLPFRLGLGGRLGHGRQWFSWISLEDLVRVIGFAIEREALAGPVLAVAPEPVTNRVLTTTLGRALRRPTVLPVPAFALRLALGGMANELLASVRCRPARLLAAGFPFAHAQLASCLQEQLSKARAGA
ncbi:MAG TPA: TIGR01777 family oxidoreductase [Planctomycetota bacterium]